MLGNIKGYVTVLEIVFVGQCEAFYLYLVLSLQKNFFDT